MTGHHPTPPWLDELHEVAAHIVSLRDALQCVGEIEPEAEEWARLTVAGELVTSAAGSLAALPPPDAAVIDAWQETTAATPAAPGDERAALLEVLRPQLHAAIDTAVAELSTPELRALASHPDEMAALVLLAGLAGRAALLAVPDAAAGLDALTEAGGLTHTEEGEELDFSGFAQMPGDAPQRGGQKSVAKPEQA